jgi:proline iminopeptidase
MSVVTPAPSRRAFSWPLALAFLGVGAAAGGLRHLALSDFDTRGFVRAPDGLRLAYEVRGQGPPLVALAGGPGISHHGFHPYLDPLADRARVIYFDPRGRGDSDPAPRYTVADDVADIDALRRGLDLGQVDLLGVSYGAHLAAAYALAHPSAVKKLVLVSPIVGATAWARHLRLLTQAAGMPAALARIRREHGEVRLSNPIVMEEIALILQPLYWCTPAHGRRAGSVFRPRHRMSRQNLRVYEDIVGRTFPELTGDLALSPVDATLGRIGAPALVIEGGCDGIAPGDSVRELARALPHAEHRLLPHSGHSPFVEETRAFVEAVARFLGTEASGG